MGTGGLLSLPSVNLAGRLQSGRGEGGVIKTHVKKTLGGLDRC